MAALIFCDSDTYKVLPNKEKFKVYNMSSSFNYGIPVGNLILQLDKKYCESVIQKPLDKFGRPMYIDILKNPEAEPLIMNLYGSYLYTKIDVFMSFFSIIYSIYLGDNVIVLVDRNEDMDAITEYFIKIIQTQYGINSYLINDPEDIDGNECSEFSTSGLLKFDTDRVSWLRVQNEYPV